MGTETPAAPAAEAPAAPAPAATPPEAAPTPPAEERKFTQKELDEIIEKRLAKERRKREETKRENDVLRRLALERGDGRAPDKPKAEQPAEDREPVRGDFPDYESFLAAQTEYRARGTARAELKKEREERERVENEKKAREAADAWRAKVKKSAEGLEDFEDVMAGISPDSAVARLPSDPIGECDHPAKVLYHLATHPEEAERIASLPQGQQAREIWKLDSTLGKPAEKPPVKPSKAPAPIDPVGGSKALAAGEMPDPNTDQAGWIRWRNEQVRAKRGGKAA